MDKAFARLFIAVVVLLCGITLVRAEQKTVLSPVYTIDKKYKSMTGPVSTQKVLLAKSKAPELLWITGYRAVMVGADGKTPMPQEFMCHSNLDLGRRLFTLSQGQLSIKFPKGFGIPVLSTQPLSLTTQVLNLNIEGRTFQVRHKVTIDFVRQAALKEPLKALMPGGAYGMQVLNDKDGYYGVPKGDNAKHGTSCLCGMNASKDVYTDRFGRVFTGHWVVKPGREVNHTLVTKIMNLPYDTTLHYIAVHLHPFAQSLELVDLTTGKSLFKSRVKGARGGKIGIERVGYFSSAKGIPVYKGHEYQIISIYDNTTKEDQDSMAVMYLYLRDKDFKFIPGAKAQQ